MISDIFSMGGFFDGRDDDCGCSGFRRRGFDHRRRFFHKGFRHFDHHRDHHRGTLLGISISL